MAFSNDLSVSSIPQKCIPVVHKENLMSYVQNPGPRLASPERENGKLAAWEFPELIEHDCCDLMDMLQFAVAYITEYHRFILDEKTLAGLLCDFVQHAKLTWRRLSASEHPGTKLSKALRRFCQNDARCRLEPNFEMLFARLEEAKAEYMRYRSMIPYFRPDSPPLASPSATEKVRTNKFLSYANTTLSLLVKATDDTSTAEYAVECFSAESEVVWDEWVGGWISSEEFRNKMVDVFRMSAPCASVINIEEEYSREIFIQNRQKAIENMRSKTVRSTKDARCKVECSICMEKFVVGNTACTTNCEHKFHKACISKWFWQSITCPLDRREQDV